MYLPTTELLSELVRIDNFWRLSFKVFLISVRPAVTGFDTPEIDIILSDLSVTDNTDDAEDPDIAAPFV